MLLSTSSRASGHIVYSLGCFERIVFSDEFDSAK